MRIERRCVETCVEDDRPAKPGLPLLLVLALLFWGGCAISYQSAHSAGRDELIVLLRVSVGVAMAFIALCAIRKVRPALVICAAVALGCSFGLMGAAQVESDASKAISDKGSWRLKLVSDCSSGAFGSSAYAEASGPNDQRLKMAVQFSDNVALLRGTMLDVQASPRSVRISSSDMYWGQGVGCTVSVAEFDMVSKKGVIAAIEGIRARAIQLIGEHGGEWAGLMQALACGYRQTISDSGEYEAYKECGLAHLVAVSGAHLAIVIFMIRWLLQLARVRLVPATLASVSFVMAYLVLAGIPISAVRAAIMVTLSLASPFAKRRDSAMSALALCIVVFVCADPPTAISASFVLSVGSTLGILMFAGLISSWFAQMPKRLQDAIGAPLGMTLASNMATLPYSMSLFSQLPLIAPLSNILASPLFVLACVSALIGAVLSCAVPAVAPIAIGFCAMGVVPLGISVGAMAKIPYACIAVSASPWLMLVITVGACAIVWVTWPRLDALMSGSLLAFGYAVISMVIAISPLAVSDEIVMLDVGQGDSFLVRSRGSTVLIDTGNKDSLLRKGIARSGAHTIDAVVITHPDDDHCGSLESLSSYTEISEVCSARALLDCDCGNCMSLKDSAIKATGMPVRGLEVGDILHVGIFDLRVVWPDSYGDEGGNSDSVCLLCEADCDEDGEYDWCALFTGDAEAEQLEQAIGEDRVGDVDVLKVGHHGSKAALTPEVARVLDPEIALISCGANNRYRHPSDEALSCLGDDVQVLRTDMNGQVALAFRKEGIGVTVDDSIHAV